MSTTELINCVEPTQRINKLCRVDPRELINCVVEIDLDEQKGWHLHGTNGTAHCQVKPFLAEPFNRNRHPDTTGVSSCTDHTTDDFD